MTGTHLGVIQLTEADLQNLRLFGVASVVAAGLDGGPTVVRVFLHRDDEDVPMLGLAVSFTDDQLRVLPVVEAVTAVPVYRDGVKSVDILDVALVGAR